MEKEIFWSKDIDPLCDHKSKPAHVVTFNNISTDSQIRSKQSSPNNALSSASNIKPKTGPALRTSSPINSNPANSRDQIRPFMDTPSIQNSNAVSQKSLNDRNNSKMSNSSNLKSSANKKPVKNMPPKNTNCQNEISADSQGSSFKSLRNEDKLKLASLIQELATLTEEHDLLKNSLDKHTECHNLEKVAFQKETRKLYQERETLIQQHHAMQQKLMSAVHELEVLKGKETSRSSVCLQTSPRSSVQGHVQQSNAPALNLSFNTLSDNSQRSNSNSRKNKLNEKKKSENNESQDRSSEKVEISVQTESATGASNCRNFVGTGAVKQVDEKLAQIQKQAADCDVGLQPVEVLSRTEDCFSLADSNLRNPSELTHLSQIEKETLALKKKIIEQEKLLELKRKQIELQHDIHNQEVSAFKANKSASEDNVRNWIESLPVSPFDNNQFSCENRQDKRSHQMSSENMPKVHFSEDKVENKQKHSSRSRSNSRSRNYSAERKSALRPKEEKRLSENDDVSSTDSTEDRFPSNDRSGRMKLNEPRTYPEKASKLTADLNDKKEAGRGKKFESVKPKVDSHYKPLREELELQPGETTDDLLLEAAGKLMHCRKLIDRSETKIDKYQYTQYMEAMERKKLEEKIPVDNQYERKIRRNVACHRSKRLIETVQPEKKDHATEVLNPFFKLVDYMDDKVDSPTKYNTAALENMATFAREFSPESELKLRTKRDGSRNMPSKSAYSSRLSRTVTRNRSSSLGRVSSNSRSVSRSRDLPARVKRGHDKSRGKQNVSLVTVVEKQNKQLKKRSHKFNTSALTSELDSDETELFDQVFFVK
ncbi:paramyosin-like [Symsagittifera roscoffensis]|uniref:paramyosin-like n=1 Tax=Symsagittifera roscoffensis TaxID=84072 RepID=UPI00307B883B